MTDNPSDHEKGTKKRPKRTKKAPKNDSKDGHPHEDGPALNMRQIAFVGHYFANGGNATQAYISAGYSKKGANRSGPQLLSNPVIRGFIRDRREAMAIKFEVTEERIIQRLAAHAFTSFKDVADPEGRWGGILRPWDMINDTHALAIKSISRSSGEANSESIAMHDPHKAAELLVRYLNLFPNEKGQKNADAGRGVDRKVETSALERLRERFTERGETSPGGAENGHGKDPGDSPGGN